MKRIMKETYSFIVLTFAVIIVISSVFAPISVAKTVEEVNDAIPIYTAQDLDNVRNGLNKSYALMNDIDLSVYENWLPIGLDEAHNAEPFTGSFYGNNHAVHNMNVNILSETQNTVYGGLFAVTEGAKISDITVDGVVHIANENKTNAAGNASAAGEGMICSGGLIGHALNSLVQNCATNVEQHLSATFIKAGGIMGICTKTPIFRVSSGGNIIINAETNIDCNQYCYVGGLIGSCSGYSAEYGVYGLTISQSVNTGNIDVRITHNEVSLNEEILSLGGIIGYCSNGDVTIEQCENLGTIYCKSIVNTVPDGVSVSNVCAGGISGSMIAGSSRTRIAFYDCKNAGDITIEATGAVDAGGLVGKAYFSESTQDSSPKSMRFFNLINSGELIAESANAEDVALGGIVGGLWRLNLAAGLLLYFTPSFTSCYSSDRALFGAFTEVGHEPYTVEAERVIARVNCKMLTAAEMREKTSYVGFNFVNVWDIDPSENDGLPTLRCFTGDTGEYLLGDVNQDAKINTGDAVHILRHCVGLATLNEEQLSLADMSCDFVVNTGDAAAVLRKCVGL